MATLPTPLRAALGLAATALEEARKLPETLPQAPVVAVSTAMQVSLRVQQRIAELAARGDEVLSQLRGTSSEPPQWATFDETPDPAPHTGSGRGVAAFDRVPEGSAGDPGESAFEVAETTGLQATETNGLEVTGTNGLEVTGTSGGQHGAETRAAGRPAKAKPTLSAETTIAPVKASPTRAAKAEAAKAARTKTAAPKAAPAKATKPTGTKTTKTTQAAGTKATKPTGTKATKRTRTASEPLAKAANRAKPSKTPNPATMAAEIVQAHQAIDQAGPTHPGTE